jgi:hypothetical protein
MEEETIVYSCPICHGHLVLEELTTPPGAPQPEMLLERKVCCPHCEMAVEPAAVTAGQSHNEGVDQRDAATANRGRSREGGTNAGGSQRGDLSDEGATQWRVDPDESLRNSWDDKPLRKSRAAKKS